MSRHRDSTPEMPERVDRYELLLPIASGGMATVYLARASGPGGFERNVALKLTHMHLRDHPELGIDLVEEAKLSAHIRHPNVVPVLDVGDDPHGVFLVLEYIEGDSLGGLQRRASASTEPMPRGIVLRILLDALSGLHAAHELKNDEGEAVELVHRDFSPQNILVGIDGITRLTDFGVAKAATRLSNTVSGLIKGKISYMSPEQARGERLDRRCDVWAAGIIAWECLAGRRLYRTDNDVATLLKIATQAPPLLRRVAAAVPAELEAAVARALTLDRSERHPTAAAFARALRDACRANVAVADTEEVAEYVRRATAEMLAHRRQRVKDMRALRAQMGAIASAAVEHAPPSGPTPPGAEITPSGGAGAEPASVEPMAGDTKTAMMSSWPGAPHGTATALMVPAPEEATTDTTSATTPRASTPELARARTPRARWRAAVTGVAIGTFIASLLVAVMLGRLALRPPTTRLGSEVFQPMARDVARAAGFAGVARSQVSAGGESRSRRLELRANAPMASLHVDGRAIPVGAPGNELTIEVPTGTTVQLEVTSSDGRRAEARADAAAKSLDIHFERRPVALPRPQAKPGSRFPASPYKR